MPKYSHVNNETSSTNYLLMKSIASSSLLLNDGLFNDHDDINIQEQKEQQIKFNNLFTKNVNFNNFFLNIFNF
jgi:hypothetical protein